jgi:hypothetical protein
MFPKPKTPRSSSHLTWLRTLPCAWCGHAGASEASHHGRRGTGIKASDLDAIPLCFWCHRDHHGLRFGRRPPLPGAPMDFPVREWAEGYARGLRFRKAEEKSR